MNPETARRTHRALEPVHAMVYFTAEPQEEYLALGLDVKANRALGYFPARAACLGVTPWQVVHALFHGFSPLAVQFGIAGVWETATPEAVLAARYRGADRALTRLLGEVDLTEAVELATEAAAACSPYGRALYAATAAVPAPDGPPHLQLWHALTLLREYRGDGHIAALVAAGITGLEAGVLHCALESTWTRKAWQATRAYSDDEWDAAEASLVERDWLSEPGVLSASGTERREAVEAATDVMGLAPWEALGEARTARLVELVKPLSRAVVDAGTFAKGPSLG